MGGQYWNPKFGYSKLQTEIVLSTLEAEYITLSWRMMDLVSDRNLVLELRDNISLELDSVGLVSKIREDNIETQHLDNSKDPPMSSRTNRIGINYHWFRFKIRLDEIEINRIGTKDQRADLFKKGLTRYEFEQKCKLIMVW